MFACFELDFNLPCAGSEQMYQALRSLNIPTRLVICPDQHHQPDVPSYLADRLRGGSIGLQVFCSKLPRC